MNRRLLLAIFEPQASTLAKDWVSREDAIYDERSGTGGPTVTHWSSNA